MVFATASDLPSEIVNRVLDYLTDPDCCGLASPTKKDLSSCSPTCRYWAQRCQPRLFREIALRSRADVYELLALLKDSRICASRFIRGIYLQVAPGDPWVHLAFFLLPSNLFECFWYFCLSITENLPDSTDSTGTAPAVLGQPGPRMYCIDRLLPRTYPPPKNLIHIVLARLTFSCFEDLLRLISSLSPLQSCRCEELSWLSRTETSPYRIRLPAQFSSVSTIGCTEDWALLRWVLLGPRLASYPLSLPVESIRHSLSRSATSFVTDVVQWMTSTGSADIVNGQIKRTLFRRDSGDARPEFHLSYTRTYRHWSNENYYVAPTVQVWCGFDERDPFRAADVLYTVFKFELREDQRLEFDWRAFDSMASFLPSLEKVVFAFQREKDLARFRVKKTPELDCLCAAEKLRFVFWEENVAGWVHARPESGTQRVGGRLRTLREA